MLSSDSAHRTFRNNLINNFKKEEMKYLALFLFIICANIMNSQTISPTLISNGGTYHKNENISIHWSVGEVAVQTYKTSDVTLTEGFYQGVLLVTPTKEVYNTFFTIYPNPTSEKLFISSAEAQISEVQIFDIKGSLIYRTNQLSDGMDVTTFPCGTYLIRILTGAASYFDYNFIKY